MFGWLKRDKKQEIERTDVKPRPSRKKRAVKPIIQEESEHSGEMIQPGKLMLKQQLITDSGTERTFVQPIKVEIPNMVTIGGKLDMILEELERKPNKEWFQDDYIETLKNVLNLTNEAGFSDPSPTEPETKKLAETIGMIQKEVSSALIIETLKVHGPLSINNLSKETGVSRVTIWRDLKKLSKDGKIKLKREGKFKVASIK